jgi:hypothetical protein
MDTKTQGEFRFVQGCFIFSALAIFIPFVFWGIKSSASLSTRVAMSALPAALMATALITGLRWADGRHRAGEGVPSLAAFPRAPIHVTRFSWGLPKAEGDRPAVKVFYENNGDAPVEQLVSCGHLGYFALSDGREKQLALEETMMSNVPKNCLEPTTNEIPAKVDRSAMFEGAPWTQHAIDSSHEGKVLIYVAGVLSYSDKHSSYKTLYCVFKGSDEEMYFCGKGNEEP